MQGCEQAMAVMLAKLPTRPFAGMTQIRFKGFGLRHLSPHGTPLGSAMLYDIHLLNTITCRAAIFSALKIKKKLHDEKMRIRIMQNKSHLFYITACNIPDVHQS